MSPKVVSVVHCNLSKVTDTTINSAYTGRGKRALSSFPPHFCLGIFWWSGTRVTILSQDDERKEILSQQCLLLHGWITEPKAVKDLHAKRHPSTTSMLG